MHTNELIGGTPPVIAGDRDLLLNRYGESWVAEMIRIRLFERKLQELFKQGALAGVVHVAIGQEAVAVGVCSNLRAGDQITVTHRGHHELLARGLDPERMFAEILGKQNGYCRGKGGSMHIAAPSLGVAGANGIVGAGIPIALGLAAAAAARGEDDVAVAFFGDGAVTQGSFHEATNLAALWKAPLILVCENNGYTEFSRSDDLIAGPGIAARAHAYGVPAAVVDGADVVAVHLAAKEAAERARAGEGPTLIECQTVRVSGHHEGEESYAGEYRPVFEERDPIEALEQLLEPTIAPERCAEIWDLQGDLIDSALAAAIGGPDAPPETAFDDLFAR